MIGWLWNLIVGQFCNHRWEQFDHRILVDDQGDRIGDKLFLKCTKCGDVKSRSL